VTGNLRSSIGYVVAVDATVEIEAINTSDKAEGISRGKALAHSLATDKGATVLIGVAGMEYGVNVEARQKDVITGPSLIAKQELSELLKEI
jgi:hypothetical protein